MREAVCRGRYYRNRIDIANNGNALATEASLRVKAPVLVFI